ncbi:MAG: hypothetical protein GY810_00095 [Aureispira sp.]|nr:hypothetical protein [Aureispira sp.]
MNKYILTPLLFLVFSSLGLQAQTFNEPVDYIRFFNKEFVNMQQLQVEYSSYLVHSRTEVADQKRAQLDLLITQIQRKFSKVTAFEEDHGIKESAVKTLSLMKASIERDYLTVAAGETGCTECFETVEKESQLSDKDSDEVGKAMKSMQDNIKKFAKTHEIDLVYDENEFNKTIVKINKINTYVRDIDLATLQVQYADGDIIKALNEKDIEGAKAALKKLGQAVNEASKRLKKVEDIKEDATCYSQAERLIEFYKGAHKEIYPQILSAFKKDGSVINEKVDTYNKYINKLNNGGNNAINKYYQAKNNLLQRNIPKPANAVEDNNDGKTKRL